ncbi:MAG TPA: tripartite tricarboxylate transporter substrate-binding protein [Alphaproteobacteria bacterium]|nr:tripartite tricarboxylate transporter substrate-binding protein [Alphaproteobacteria bacterium]
MRNSIKAATVLAVAAVAGLALVGASVAHAQSAEKFYKGKQIRFIIPSGAGGGYDAYSRFLARHLGDHIPGKPHLVVENMPGASGLRGTNYLYNVAPKDGTVLGSTYNNLLVEPLLGNKAAEWDSRKFEWVGSITTQYNSCMVWATSPIKTIEDAMKQEVKVSTTGLSGNSAKTPLELNKLIGTKFKVIAGYSTTGMRLAVERGEVDGICGLSYDTYEAANPDWILNHRIRFILQTGSVPNKAIPNVPLLTQYVKDPKDLAALKVLGVGEDAGRPHMFPPGVPKYLVEAMRRAFDATMKDPKFLAEAKKLHIQPDPMTGEQMEKEIIEAYKAPKEVVARAAELWPVATKKEKQ